VTTPLDMSLNDTPCVSCGRCAETCPTGALMPKPRILQKYDVAPYVDPASAGGIPFILVGGRYMWSGSPFSPDVLAGQAQDRIAATLPAGSGAAARAILANANELTATICALDGNRPTEVCSDPVIQTAIKALPSKAP